MFAGVKAKHGFSCVGERENEKRKRAQTLKHTVFIAADVVTSSEKNAPHPTALLVLMELSKSNGW